MTKEFKIGDEVEVLPRGTSNCNLCYLPAWSDTFREKKGKVGTIIDFSDCAAGNVKMPLVVKDEFAVWLCPFTLVPRKGSNYLPLKAPTVRCRCNGRAKDVYLGIGPAAPLISICESCGEEK